MPGHGSYECRVVADSEVLAEHWWAAALLEQIVLLRPLTARNEFLGYGVAVAYIQASGEITLLN
nr:hypothetical protein [Streptomyces sp. Ru71]